MGIAGIDAVNKSSKMRMLGKVATQSHHPSSQNLRHRVEVRGGSGVQSHGVGREMIVRPNGLSNSCVEQPHGRDAVRRDFTATQPSGEHQGAHDSLFGVVVPIIMLQLVGKASSHSESVVESAAEQTNTRRGMGPKIPEMQNDRDGFVEGNPDMVGKLGSGRGLWKTGNIFV